MKFTGAFFPPCSPLLLETPRKYHGFFFRRALGAAVAANFKSAAAGAGVRTKYSKMLPKTTRKSFKNESKTKKISPMKSTGDYFPPCLPLLLETPRKYRGFFFRRALGAAVAANLESAAAVAANLESAAADAGVRAKNSKTLPKKTQKTSK